jgi:hypothetical protein
MDQVVNFASEEVVVEALEVLAWARGVPDSVHQHHLFVLEVEVDEMLTGRLYLSGMEQEEVWVFSLSLLSFVAVLLVLPPVLVSLLASMALHGRLYLG